MASQKKTDEVVESLGEKAMAAYRNGTEWEYAPESMEAGEWWAAPCDSETCGHAWHKRGIAFGYSIHDGVVDHDVYEYDEEWNHVNSCNIDDPLYDEWLSEYSHQNRQQGWKEYAAYVSETGDDILDEYIVEDKVKETWIAKLVQDGDAVRFVGAHRKSLARFDRIAIKDVAQLPSQVREFLCVDESGLISEITSLDQLRSDSWKAEIEGESALITFDLDVPVHPDIVRERKRLAAENHLEDEFN